MVGFAPWGGGAALSLLSRYTLPLIIAFVLYIRLHFLIVDGGLGTGQIDWATRYHLGGILAAYLHMRDAILAARTEQDLWSYLPG